MNNKITVSKNQHDDKGDYRVINLQNEFGMYPAPKEFEVDGMSV